MGTTKETKKSTEPMQKHRVLREIYRHYYEFEAYVSATGKHVIEHSQPVRNDDGDIIGRVPVTISFFDLKDAILNPEVLSERKRQAVMLNVIRDLKQKDVAAIMNITTVSVGQYVEQAMLQLSTDYFAEMLNEDELKQIVNKGS